MKKIIKWVAVSGGFDPIHIGHTRMIKEARKYGDKVVIILNNDNWLRAKKGFVFMPEKERAELLLACGADRVYITKHKPNDKDRSVNKALTAIHPDIFCNGGDRAFDNIPEVSVCEKYNIRMIFNVGAGGKAQSSSWLTDKVRTAGIQTTRPWGSMILFAHKSNFWVKMISIDPGQSTSLQKHSKRDELWMCVKGKVFATIENKTISLKPFQFVKFKKGTLHRLGSKKGGTVIEIGSGKCDEKDIKRYEDIYGRI